MRREFTLRKRVIGGGVILLVLADIAMALYSWELASAPRTPREQFSAEMQQHNLLKADLKRALDIQAKIPAIQKDCDQFEQSLLSNSSGYSSVTADLDVMAKKAGIQLEGRTFRPTEIASRKMTEVAVDATVSGDYKSVIQFLNGLQRSANLYEVDSLALASETASQAPAGIIKVAVHLKTYFRIAS